MRSIVGACLVVLALAGCGGSGDDSGAGSPPTDDPCSLLSTEDASRIVGVTYVKQTRNDDSDPDVCLFEQDMVTAPFGFSIFWWDAELDEVVAELRASGEAATIEQIAVAGTDEAVVLTSMGSGLTLQRIAGAVGHRVLVLSFGGSPTIASELMAAALGEDVPDNNAQSVIDACGLDRAEVEAAVGASTAPIPHAHDPAWSACEWKSGAGASFWLRIARDAGSLSWYARGSILVPAGKPRGITVDGADEAVLIRDPHEVHSSATALAAVDRVIYEVKADDTRGRDAALIATAVIAAAIGSS